MCGLQFLGCLSIIPYLLVFLMPVFGFFYGKEPILRLSIYLICQSIFSSLTSKVLLFAEPLVQIAVLVGLFSLRVTLVPASLLCLYDVALFVSEPLWQVMEAAGVVYISMSLSQEAADRMDDKPGLAKGYILSVAGVCYALTLGLLWNIIQTDSVFYIWAAILLSVCILGVHMFTLSHESGIISDAAVVGLCSVAFLYDVCHRSAHNVELVTLPDAWTSYISDHSYLQMCAHLLSGSGEALVVLRQVFTPWFVCTLLARCCCVLFTIAVTRGLFARLVEWSEERTTIQSYDDEDNDTDDLEDDPQLPLTLAITRSPLMVKLVVIFVLTQFLVCHIHSHLYEDTSWLSWLQAWFPSGRWIQIVLLNTYYLHRLYSSTDDKNDSFW